MAIRHGYKLKEPKGRLLTLSLSSPQLHLELKEAKVAVSSLCLSLDPALSITHSDVEFWT